MLNTVKFHSGMAGIAADHNKVQEFTRDTFDKIIADAIEDSEAYTGLSTTVTNTAEVTVGAGRYYKDGVIYDLVDPKAIDLFSVLPVTTKLIVALCVSGQTVDSEAENRKFISNVETRETQVKAISTSNVRAITLQTVVGVENASPKKPVVNTDLLPFAWVTLGTAGVESVEMDSSNLLDTIYGNAARLSVIEQWQASLGAQLKTIGSDIAKLNNKVTDVTYNDVIYELAGDIARLKELNELEDNHTSYGADRFLDAEESDTENLNYLAKLSEGVRFSADAEDETALQLFNPLNPDVTLSDGFLLPKYKNVVRIALEEYAEATPISQYPFQTVEYKRRTMARQRIRYGSESKTCTNSAWWRAGQYDPVSNIFTRDGDTWEVVSGDPNRNHRMVRLRRFWIDTYEDSYWDRIVSDHSINGSVVAQTFLNTQDNWCTQIDLPFTQVDSSGDIQILITKTHHGKPDVDNAIQAVTLSQSDMKTWPEWTSVAVPPTFLEAGQQYSIILVTGGNHYVGLTSGENFSQGTYFYSTDGQFFQGNLTLDLMFRLYAAEFDNPRIEVPLSALSLSGGIADIDLMFEGIAPEGTSLVFEVRPSGGVWTPLEAVVSGNHILHGLPALCEFRAVFLGTRDIHAGIRLDTSRINISRPRTTFTHISNAITLGSATQSLKIKILLEWYDEANHDLTCVIDDVTNASNDIAPAVVSDEEIADIEGAEKRIMRTFEWTATELSTATSEFVIKLNGTTTSALQTFHVAERIHLAF